MTYLVSITSQGQIGIPADVRRKLGLDAWQKAVVRQVGDEIVIKPAVDILSLKGSLKKYAKKGKSFEEI